MSKDIAAQQDTQRKPRVNKPVQKEMNGMETAVALPTSALQRAYADPRSLSPADAKILQRTIGNQALGQLIIQRKMTVGPVGDKYEQEADSVAKQVVGKLHTTHTHNSPAATTQRQEDEQELQMKLLPNISSLQRQEEEELQLKPLVQRQEEEEELQAKGDPMLAGGELSGDVESSVQSAKSGGQPMSDNIRGPIEQAFNADFSGVKVHTGSQSDSLNRSLSARAFTSGQDVFFRQGEYNLGNSRGQELLAHELTHVLQQSGGAVQRQSDLKVEGMLQGKFADGELSTQLQSTLGKVQRTIWVYGSDQFWEKEKKDVIKEDEEDSNRSQNPPNLPVKESYDIGDSYDDTAPNPIIYSGTNARTLGAPGRVYGYDQIDPAEAEMFRKGLGIAKLKLARSISVVKAGRDASRSGAIDAYLASVLEVAFNMPTDLKRTEQYRILEILVTGLERLQVGLSQDELPLISSGYMAVYGKRKPADCTGWVPRGITEIGGQDKPAETANDLKPVSGEIHMKTGALSNPSFVADTLIHEGCHKFLGSWDYSYVGVQGSVGTGLNTKAQQLQADDDTLSPQQARQQVKTNSKNIAFANIVKGIVAKGLKTHLPEALDRGRPIQDLDTPAVKAAKTTWNLVRGWGGNDNPFPDPALVAGVIEVLLLKESLDSSAKSELIKFKADQVKYLADNGNALGVKGHEVLFTLPTNYLLKNADSWTELALTVAG